MDTPSPTPAASAGPYAGYTALHITLRAGVATVTLDNPPLNLLDATLITELSHFATTVATDEQVRVVVFESADPDFFIPHGNMGFVTDPASFAQVAAADPEPSLLNPMQKLHERLRALPQITIAKLTGLARGGGAELASALDMRFGARGRMGLAQMEVLTGIIPGGGATVYLPHLLGRARSLEVILGAALFDADLAERYGWINRALPAEELEEFVDGLARRIAALPPGVARAAKVAVGATLGPQTQGLAEENAWLNQTFAAPIAAQLTRAALAAGAQTREGERNLETLLSKVLAQVQPPAQTGLA